MSIELDLIQKAPTLKNQIPHSRSISISFCLFKLDILYFYMKNEYILKIGEIELEKIKILKGKC